MLQKPGEEKPINANFWADVVNPVQQQLGKQLCTKVEEPKNGPGQASIVTHNTWQTANGTKMLDEKRTLHLVSLGDAQLIIFDIDLHATEGDITFEEIRMASWLFAWPMSWRRRASRVA